VPACPCSQRLITSNHKICINVQLEPSIQDPKFLTIFQCQLAVVMTVTSVIQRMSCSKNGQKVVKFLHSPFTKHYWDNWMLTYVCSDEPETLFTILSQETTTSLSNCTHRQTWYKWITASNESKMCHCSIACNKVVEWDPPLLKSHCYKLHCEIPDTFVLTAFNE